MRKRLKLLVILILVFIAGIAIQRFLFSTKNTVQPVSVSKKKVLYWVAPMDSSYRRDKAGKSPMGMDLVPVYADSVLPEKSVIQISPEVEHNLGVKTTIVKRMNLSRVIKTIAYVTSDENNIERIHTYTSGWIRKLYVRSVGENVRKGQLLLELYSPSLINAEQEYLLALKNNLPSLIRAGKKKLITLGMSRKQITHLHNTRRVMELVKVYVANGGIVAKLNVREGMFIKPEQTIITIEDLSHIWMIAEVFEKQSSWVKLGQPVIAALSFMPGKIWQGKVDYIYPQLNPKTHTLRIRLVFPNPDLTIKPNMYANVKIYALALKNVLAIPHSALIRTGLGDRVILALGQGKFKAVPVVVGVESENHYQVLSGLKAGDKVVVSAQFLIDSESNFQSGFERLQQKKQNHQKHSHLPTQFVATGVVKLVDLKNRVMAIEHRPIPSLNMPAMLMKLPVSKLVDLKMIQKNDAVQFILIRQAQQGYQIKNVQVVRSVEGKGAK